LFWSTGTSTKTDGDSIVKKIQALARTHTPRQSKKKEADPDSQEREAPSSSKRESEESKSEQAVHELTVEESIKSVVTRSARKKKAPVITPQTARISRPTAKSAPSKSTKDEEADDESEEKQDPPKVKVHKVEVKSSKKGVKGDKSDKKEVRSDKSDDESEEKQDPPQVKVHKVEVKSSKKGAKGDKGDKKEVRSDKSERKSAKKTAKVDAIDVITPIETEGATSELLTLPARTTRSLRSSTPQAAAKVRSRERAPLTPVQLDRLPKPVTNVVVKSPRKGLLSICGLSSSTKVNLDKPIKVDWLEGSSVEIKPKVRIFRKQLFGFGYGQFGQIGYLLNVKCSNKALQIRTPVSFGKMSGSYNHTALIGTDGQLYTFGQNDLGALGRDPVDLTHAYFANAHCRPVPEANDVRQVATGSTFTVWIDKSGRLFAVGGLRPNDQEECGLSPETDKPSYSRKLIAEQCRQVVCGEKFVMFVNSDKQLKTFGVNDKGQLGRPLFHPNLTDLRPEVVTFGSGLVKVKAIWAGYNSAFALSEDEQLFAWGDNNEGQLALGSEECVRATVHQPQEVTFISKNQVKVKKVTAGRHHTLALDDQGRLFSFGSNRYGQLGSNCCSTSAQTRKSLPMLVESFLNEEVVDIACGQFNSYCLLKNGEALVDFSVLFQINPLFFPRFRNPQEIFTAGECRITSWECETFINIRWLL
jgi:alpha-tubulin suppressor-like RCC1 family protein